ncbi:MAG TPA: DUF6084 family protein [Bryobacteraceae bacterium]|nr:DUF6084 family protein [Bryobacteraceae bacterium]
MSITVGSAAAVRYAATPSIAFELNIKNADPEEILHTVVLRCQIQIEVARRKYGTEDQEKLRDLFGEPERWGQTLRSLLWTHASAVVPQFKGATSASMQVPCTFDFNVAATKYFNGLADGDIPLCLMFSGTIFYADSEGSMRVAPISWDKETRFRLPLKVWQEMMDVFYPNIAWLSLRRDVFELLHDYKVRHGIPSWEQTIEKILAEAGETVKL